MIPAKDGEKIVIKRENRRARKYIQLKGGKDDRTGTQ